MSTDITISKQRSRELTDIAKSINDREEAIETLKRQTVSKANEAVTEAVLQGQELIKARAMVPHGLWDEWLKCNCPAISRWNAYRYMALAKNVGHVQQIGGAESMRAMFALIAERHQPKQVGDGGEQWPIYLEGIYRASKWLGFVERNPIDQWPSEGKDKLKQDLEPVCRVLWPERFV